MFYIGFLDMVCYNGFHQEVVMKNILKNSIHGFSLMSLLMLSVSCVEEASQQSSVPTARVEMQLDSYTTAYEKIIGLFIPSSYAAVSTLRLCFKRVRFKLTDSDDFGGDDENVDFFIGEVDLGTSGYDLGSVEVPARDYQRIEFDLEPSCASGKSLDLVNDQGSFSTSDRITIKFSGNFKAQDGAVLRLSPQKIINALNSYTGGSRLKDTAESISGTL